jgi:hypothetical protein
MTHAYGNKAADLEARGFIRCPRCKGGPFDPRGFAALEAGTEKVCYECVQRHKRASEDKAAILAALRTAIWPGEPGGANDKLALEAAPRVLETLAVPELRTILLRVIGEV